MKRLFVATVALFAALNASAQDPALLEKAKAEGKASFYANITDIDRARSY